MMLEYQIIGFRDPDSNLYTGTLQQVCSLGGFEVKEIIRSGDVNDKATHLLGDSVLGYLCYTKDLKQKKNPYYN